VFLIEEFFGSRESIAKTSAEFTSEAKWRVTVEITQKRRKKLEDPWEEKVMTCTAFNTEIGSALAEASMTLTIYLDGHNGDLFSEDTPTKSTEELSQ
jgi:hypothetical protein